jgi:hypothetical protein
MRGLQEALAFAVSEFRAEVPLARACDVEPFDGPRLLFLDVSEPSDYLRRPVGVLGSQRRQGRLKCVANFAVQRVPGSSLSGLATRKITVASEQNTFNSVRCDRLTSEASRLVSYGVGWSGYSAGIGPSSSRRSGGHQPPHSRPQSIAACKAVWSTPLCPPETTLNSRATDNFRIQGCGRKRRRLSATIQIRTLPCSQREELQCATNAISSGVDCRPRISLRCGKRPKRSMTSI